MEIETLLHEEIVDEFKQLKGIEVGTDEYKTTVDGLTKLMDRAIEIDKLEKEAVEKKKTREFDEELRLKQFESQIDNLKAEVDLKLKQHESQIASQQTEFDLRRKQISEEQKDQIIRNCIAAAGIVIPSIITIWGTLKSIEFEKEGTITTIMGRGFINKLLPKK